MKPEFSLGDRGILVRGPGQTIRPELVHLEGESVLIIGELMERELFQDLERSYAVPTWCYRVSSGPHRFCVQPFNLRKPPQIIAPDSIGRQQLGNWNLCPWSPERARR